MSEVLEEYPFPGGQRLQLALGDITEEQVDAIVNAANAHLQHGGGVAGVIARRGGPAIQQESDTWVRQHGPVSHANPAYTTAGRLPCRFVIHAVGPVWGSTGSPQEADQKLAATVRGSLERAAELELESLALPAISTGIFGFPKDRAAGVILSAIRNYYIEENPETRLRLVRVVLYDRPTMDAFRKVWGEVFS